MKKLSTDKDLLSNILLNKTKVPITRERWLEFVESSYTAENTMCYIDLLIFFEKYHSICGQIGLSSNITDEIVSIPPISGMIDFETSAADNEFGLKNWSETICIKLVDKYIKVGSKKEVNLSSKIRDECLAQFRNGKYHPSIFKEVKDAVFEIMIVNDLPKFKAIALDQNIELQHRRMRAIAGFIFTGVSIALYTFFIANSLSQYYRFIGFPALFCVFVCYFQWKAKFCIGLADIKQRNTKGYVGLAAIEDEYACQYQSQRSLTIKLKSFACAATVFIILFALPPYVF